jgi:transcriptional regulator with XRE-family HTH domain
MAKRKTRDTSKLNLIKDVLESQGKTQTWLADALNRDFVTVTRYVNNKRQPTLETLFEIARILKISPRELING